MTLHYFFLQEILSNAVLSLCYTWLVLWLYTEMLSFLVLSCWVLESLRHATQSWQQHFVVNTWLAVSMLQHDRDLHLQSGLQGFWETEQSNDTMTAAICSATGITYSTSQTCVHLHTPHTHTYTHHTHKHKLADTCTCSHERKLNNLCWM